MQNDLVEITPAIHQGLDHAIALYLAKFIVGVEGSIARYNLLNREWRNMLRILRLDAYYSNLQEAHKWRADSYQNRRFMRRG